MRDTTRSFGASTSFCKASPFSLVKARAREIEAARALLTPEGISVISTSYRNEAGAAALLKSRLGGAADVKTPIKGDERRSMQSGVVTSTT